MFCRWSLTRVYWGLLKTHEGDDAMEPSQEVLSVLAEYAGKELPALREIKGNLHRTVRETEQSHQEALDRLRATLFVSRFADLVRCGVLDKLASEQEFAAITDGYARSEMKQFLWVFRGLIIVYKLHIQFQGRSNEKDYEPPRWVTYAQDLLAHGGWTVTVKREVFAEAGIGNTLNVYLCIPDPRPEEEQARLLA